MNSPTATKAVTPPETRRAMPQSPTGVAYVIDGRPFSAYPTIEDAIAEAESLTTRLRLSMILKIRVAGTDRVVATVSRDDAGVVVVVL